jgi:hypothetical protein
MDACRCKSFSSPLKLKRSNYNGRNMFGSDQVIIPESRPPWHAILNAIDRTSKLVVVPLFLEDDS